MSSYGYDGSEETVVTLEVPFVGSLTAVLQPR